jgi:hypothetical protein
VLRALVRFGFPDLEAAGPDTAVRPITVIHAGLIPFYDRAAAAGIEERYLLVIDGEEHWLSSVPGEQPDGTGAPDLVLEGPAWAFIAARQGGPTLAEAIADGTIHRTGSAKSQRSFERVFSF